MSLNIDISLDSSKIASLINDRSLLSNDPKKKAELFSSWKKYLSDCLEEQRRLQGTLTEEDFFKLQQRLFEEIQKQQQINKNEQAKALLNKENFRLKKMLNNLLFKIAREKGFIGTLIKRVLFRARLIKKRLKAYYRDRRRKKIRADRKREESLSDWDQRKAEEDEALLKEKLEKEKKPNEQLETNSFRYMTDEELKINAGNTSENVSGALYLMRNILGLENIISEQEIKSFQKELANNLFILDKSTTHEEFSKGLDEKLFAKLDQLDNWHARTKNHLRTHHPHDQGRHKILDDCFHEIEKDILSWLKRDEVHPRFSNDPKHLAQKKTNWQKLMSEGPKPPIPSSTPQFVPLESESPALAFASVEHASFERMRQQQADEAAQVAARLAHSPAPEFPSYALRKNIASSIRETAEARARAQNETAEIPITPKTSKTQKPPK